MGAEESKTSTNEAVDMEMVFNVIQLGMAAVGTGLAIKEVVDNVNKEIDKAVVSLPVSNDNRDTLGSVLRFGIAALGTGLAIKAVVDCLNKETTGTTQRTSLHEVCQLSPCLRFNADYMRILTLMRRSLPNVEINSVTRIDNKLLDQCYALKEQEMKRRRGEGGLNEMWLFYGTTLDKIDSICSDGFDVSCNGEHKGTLTDGIFGRRTYFAKEASYADDYCQVDSLSGYKKVLVTKVLLGKYKHGPYDSDYESVDSYVNNKENPTIFTILNSSQVTPKYIVEYY